MLGRTKRRWKFNIKVPIKEIRWEGVDWVREFGRDKRTALVNT